MDHDRCYTLFSDFNCPFCYALHERLHALRLIDRCAWKGVQHAPHLPQPMRRWTGSFAADLRHEVDLVQRLSPGLPLQLPIGKPNTGESIARAAAVLEKDREAGMMLVRAIYRSFWLDGQDLSDARILDEVTGTSPPDGSWDRGRQIAGQWNAAWQSTAQAGVPLIVAANGDMLVGCVPRDQLAEFFSAHE